jgi:hypothetical protein
MDKPLGAAADGAVEGPHLHLAWTGRSDRLVAQLGTAGADIPEGFALHCEIIPGGHAGLVYDDGAVGANRL